MRATFRSTCILPIMLLVLTILATPSAAAQPSIPINGRYSIITVKIYIPAYPKWAHDTVLKAAIAWNQAQLWSLRNNPSKMFYFLEADESTATSIVSFSMPSAYSTLAVGWTCYTFAPGSTTEITSTQTYLNPSIFNASQASNVTATRYGFWLALHELGRILGLGSVLDQHDIMDPLYTPERINGVPQLSTLDLYALHVLAQGSDPNFVALPVGVQDLFTPVTNFLP